MLSSVTKLGKIIVVYACQNVLPQNMILYAAASSTPHQPWWLQKDVKTRKLFFFSLLQFFPDNFGQIFEAF